MFFQGGGGTQDTTISLGPITLSWKLIMIGLQSSVIVMPVNILLVTIFRKLAPKETKSKKYEVQSFNEPDVDDNTNDQEPEVADSKKSRFGMFSKNKSEEPKKKFLFPYWCIYVAYLLCFISTGTSAFFTMMYGFQFGKEKSEKWLTAMVVSVFQSVVVIQPVKVLMLAAIFALIIKDPNKEEEEMEQESTAEETMTGNWCL